MPSEGGPSIPDGSVKQKRESGVQNMDSGLANIKKLLVFTKGHDVIN